MQQSVARFRPFKIPNVVETQFFESDSQKNEEFMLEDLARSGLEPDDIQAYAHPMMRLARGAEAGYVIPYYDLDGDVLTDSSGYITMHRARYKYPPMSKAIRYSQPSSEELNKAGLPSYIPYIPPRIHCMTGDTIYCCEGEKKTAAVIKYLNVPAFGIGGCHMWTSPDGSGEVHPWILDLISRGKWSNLVIIPDGDIQRYDINKAYGTFVQALGKLGISAKILNPGGKIDDLLVSWGPEAGTQFAQIPELSSGDLAQTIVSLVRDYNLAFKKSEDGKITVYQHSANVMRLLEAHPAFPKIWRNLDTNVVMVGDKPAVPDKTEMDIANHFQYNFGFEKVNTRLVYSCIQALAKTNQRSPMLEWIQSLRWDGVARLDTWLCDYWGCSDTPYVREVASKWLISACARMASPGTKVDWMMIVIGPQGTGKTSMPAIMFKGNCLTLYGEHNDKDLHMLLHSALVVGFDELDSFGKREASNLKAMITRNEDAFRPPYGASVEVFPRRFTLYGCGNRYEFLQNDPSGYRRYAIIEVNKLLDFAGLEAVRDHLWAEAWARYSRGGVRYWEISGASANAERYVIPNVLEDQIQNWLWAQAENKNGTNCKDGYVYFTMSQLLMGVNHEGAAKNPHVTRDIAATLRKLGCEQRNTSKEVAPGVRGRHYVWAVSQT